MAHLRTSRLVPLLLAALGLSVAGCAGKSATAEPARTARPAAAAAVAPTTSPRTVTVQATGKASAVPNQLVARLAIHTTGPTADGVLSDANVRARAVLDTLKRSGVAAKDVQTTQVGLGPTFDKKGNVTGFAADNNLQITFRRLAVAGRQLDAVVRVPGNAARLESVSLGFNNDDKLLAAARVDGVRRARAQATQMVQAAGGRLGAVRTISESSASSPVAERSAAAFDAAPASAVPIAAGTQERNVSVRVVFAIA